MWKGLRQVSTIYFCFKTVKCFNFFFRQGNFWRIDRYILFWSGKKCQAHKSSYIFCQFLSTCSVQFLVRTVFWSQIWEQCFLVLHSKFFCCMVLKGDFLCVHAPDIWDFFSGTSNRSAKYCLHVLFIQFLCFFTQILKNKYFLTYLSVSHQFLIIIRLPKKMG